MHCQQCRHTQKQHYPSGCAARTGTNTYCKCHRFKSTPATKEKQSLRLVERIATLPLNDEEEWNPKQKVNNTKKVVPISKVGIYSQIVSAAREIAWSSG